MLDICVKLDDIGELDADWRKTLCSSIELEYRGHDPEVLKSYTKFLEVGYFYFVYSPISHV